MDRTTRPTATRRPAAVGRRGLRGVLVAGVLAAGLAACQTGADPASPDGTTGATPTPTATATTGPTEPAGPTEEPTASPEPTPGGSVVNGPNSVTSPAPDETVTSPFTARGEGTAFEATLLYRVVAAGTDDVVTEGFTTAGANGEVGPWEIPLDLGAGTWTLQVWEPDMSDGEGEGDEGMRNLVEVTFTVA